MYYIPVCMCARSFVVEIFWPTRSFVKNLKGETQTKENKLVPFINLKVCGEYE